MTPPPRGDDKPLAAASRNLRQLAKEQKAGAKRDAEAFASGQPVTPEPPGSSSVEVVAAMRQSVDARTKRLEMLRRQFERVAGNSSIPMLDQLAGILSLYERRIARRNATKG